MSDLLQRAEAALLWLVYHGFRALPLDTPSRLGGWLVRTKGARFRAEFLKPLRFNKTGDRAADQLAAMTRVNQLLEGWIAETPSQWLWLHRRWSEELYCA
jgi:hypothetical protein